jgi:hypothetical protein
VVMGIAEVRNGSGSEPSDHLPARGTVFAAGIAVAVLAVAALWLLAVPATASAAQRCVQITDRLDSDHSEAETDFFAWEETIVYSGGPVTLARDCEGTTAMWVDDAIVVDVDRPGGSSSSFEHDFSGGCSGGITHAGPFDLTSHFLPGPNEVSVRLRDLCGQGGSGASPVHLIYELPARPELTVRVPKRAKVSKRLRIPLDAGCDRPCALVAKGAVVVKRKKGKKPVKLGLKTARAQTAEAGELRALELKAGKKAARKLARLARSKRTGSIRAKLTVSARDESGMSAVATRKVKLTKPKKKP